MLYANNWVRSCKGPDQKVEGQAVVSRGKNNPGKYALKSEVSGGKKPQRDQKKEKKIVRH